MCRPVAEFLDLLTVTGPLNLFATEDGHEAVWHARASVFPAAPLSEWPSDSRRDVKRLLLRLLRGLGKGSGVDIKKGAEDPVTSVHFYREATTEEIASAVRVTEESSK